MNELIKPAFVIFDVETTGLFPETGDRMIEIAALKVTDLQIVDKFYSLLDPQREISLGAYEVNGITPGMLQGAPEAKDVLPRFLKFLGGAHLVGHNIKFDLGFLCHELSLLDMKLHEKTMVVDTLKLARRVLPALGRYPLWLVAESLGIKIEQKHRAMADVELTLQVFQRLMESKKSKNPADHNIYEDVLDRYQVFSR